MKRRNVMALMMVLTVIFFALSSAFAQNGTTNQNQTQNQVKTQDQNQVQVKNQVKPQDQNQYKNQIKNQNQIQGQNKFQNKIHGSHFIDLNKDGYNDNAPDLDGDGIPNGQDPDYTRPLNGKGSKFMGDRNGYGYEYKNNYGYGSGNCNGTGNGPNGPNQNGAKRGGRR